MTEKQMAQQEYRILCREYNAASRENHTLANRLMVETAVRMRQLHGLIPKSYLSKTFIGRQGY